MASGYLRFLEYILQAPENIQNLLLSINSPKLKSNSDIPQLKFVQVASYFIELFVMSSKTATDASKQGLVHRV